MKTPKIKRYRLGVSQNFPTKHPRKGEPTYFIDSIKAKLKGHELLCDCGWTGKYSELKEKTLDNGFSSAGEACYVDDDRCPNCGYYAKEHRFKCHTIRANYLHWEKRIKEVQAGRAVIELFYWEGKPYNSKQIVFATLDKDSGCGVQELKFVWNDINHPWLYSEEIASGHSVCGHFSTNDLANNDGLSLEDFKAWFKGYDLSNPMAIIHFTKFRY